MTDIVIVVDAQNSFCHLNGVSTREFAKTEKERRELEKTIARIKQFLEKARAREMPIFYLCANENATNVALWNIQIHYGLLPQANEEVFWRNDPEDDLALDKTIRSLQERFPEPHFLLCGFYSHWCVTRVALRAIKVSIPVSFVVDCVFYRLTNREQKSFSYIKEQVSFNFDESLMRFVMLDTVFPNANPPVPQ